jgi:exodeoxyribonuclease-1
MQTLYFYDLETSGINPRSSRIMQFAGQRTDLDLVPIGDPDNIIIKLSEDILPDPDAIMITGISPQQTLADGITESEFLDYFHKKIALKGTIFAGFNTIRFDDEFIRFTNYRNFYDAYEWQWQDQRSKWDILDVVRMTRALRPDGINWPFTSDGKASNRLELLTSVNRLDHFNAHDALSDVNATIAVARLIKQKQPKLFDYLLSMRDKNAIAKLVNSSEPFIYTSGRYSAEFEKTTVVISIASHPVQKGSVFVYDLRYDPAPFADMSPEQLAELMAKYKFEEGDLRLPVKQLQFNKCPAVAPMNVLDMASKNRLKIDTEIVNNNLQKLAKIEDFGDRIQEAVRINEKQRQQSIVSDINIVDNQLYDGFFNDYDKEKMRLVRESKQDQLADLSLDFADSRLGNLLLLYKARQFPSSLNIDEQSEWQTYKKQKILDGDQESPLVKYFSRIDQLSKQSGLTKNQQYLLEELKLYGQSIVPYDSES